MSGGAPSLSRRRMLGIAAGSAAGAVAGSAATGSAAAQDDGEGVPAEYGDWFTDSARGGAVGNYDGTTVDRTGQEEVTITVGADGNNGTFAFAPPAVRISSGTTVTFEWTSDTHNVVIEEQPDGADWSGHEPIEDSGFSFTHTFETNGVYKYLCEPHLSLGMKAAIVIGPAPAGSGGGAGETVPAEYGDWFTDSARGGAVGNYDGTTVNETGQEEVSVTVGADGNGGTFAYAPPALRVSPGTTVTFEWVSDTHNVVVEEQPEDAAWEGHQPIENSGFSFTHTFETPGVYKYLCEPHLSLGMKGAIVVGAAPAGEDGGPAAGAGGGDDAAFAFDWVLAGSVVLALLAPIVVSYYRYWDDGDRSGTGPAIAADEPVPEAPEAEPVEEIGHDEYDPMGTLALIAMYGLILLVMWVFMYFIEFLGNGPSVIG